MAGSIRTRIPDRDSSIAPTARAVRRDAEEAPSGATAPHAVNWAVREVMDIRQAADYLGISPDSLYKYASENFIPAFKLGNRWRFKRSLLESWIEQQSMMSVSLGRQRSVKLKQKKPVGRAR